VIISTKPDNAPEELAIEVETKEEEKASEVHTTSP